MAIYERENPKGNTQFYVIQPDGNQFKEFVDWPFMTTWTQVCELVAPYVEGRVERMPIWHQGEIRDFFVNRDAKPPAFKVNPVATEIIRAHHLRRFPKTDPDQLPQIYGTAILFGRRMDILVE